MPATPRLSLVLALLDEAFDRRSWHGTNLRGSLRGLPLSAAVFRPGPGRRSVQELVLHAAYWKYAVRRRLTGQKRGSFPLAGSNWFDRPAAESTEASWRADVALLVSEHRALRAAVAALSEKGLGPDGGIRMRLLRGMAAHDLYHAGQIQLLKRLARG